jgi:hypothetical protein
VQKAVARQAKKVETDAERAWAERVACGGGRGGRGCARGGRGRGRGG